MKKQAFTLVELIVVVTILAILATIGFVSYSGYLTGVRDTNRIASLTSISDGLELYRTKNDLPNPDDGINIQIEGTTIANQGYAGVNVLQTIEYSKAGRDPKDDSYYSYYLTDDKKHYQLMAFLEETENLETNYIRDEYFRPLQANAAVNYSNRHPKVYGKKLGILTDSNNTPVQETTSSNLNFTGGTTTDYIARFTDSNNITASGSNLSTIAGDASCKRIKELKGSSKDGIYSVNPTGTGTIDVYCDMTTKGGGWTLIIKADGSQQTFTYTANIWTNTNTLNPQDLSDKKSEFKSALFSTEPFGEVLLVFDTDNIKTNMLLSKKGNSLHEVFNAPYSPVEIGKQTWINFVPGGSLQPNCNQEGFNANRTRIGISANNETSCSSNDSYLGMGLQVRNGSVGNFTSSVGNNCGSSDCSQGNKQINSFGYLYIR